jgi:hypothetical protein
MWICPVAPGQALYILGVCPENRDELQRELDNIISVRFIPIFGALHPQLYVKGIPKKDIPMFRAKKRHLRDQQKVSFTYNHEAERRRHLLK